MGLEKYLPGSGSTYSQMVDPCPHFCITLKKLSIAIEVRYRKRDDIVFTLQQRSTKVMNCLVSAFPPLITNTMSGVRTKGTRSRLRITKRKTKNYSLLYSREYFLSVSSHSKHGTRQCCGSGSSISS
jgi:hypothetical protein